MKILFIGLLLINVNLYSHIIVVSNQTGLDDSELKINWNSKGSVPFDIGTRVGNHIRVIETAFDETGFTVTKKCGDCHLCTDPVTIFSGNTYVIECITTDDNGNCKDITVRQS